MILRSGEKCKYRVNVLELCQRRKWACYNNFVSEELPNNLRCTSWKDYFLPFFSRGSSLYVDLGWRSHPSTMMVLSSCLSLFLSQESSFRLIISILILSKSYFYTTWWIFHRKTSKPNILSHKLLTPNNAKVINSLDAIVPRPTELRA